MMEGVKPEYIQSQKYPMPGYKEIWYYIIFDIKMDVNFTRKSILLVNGHETDYVHKWDTYSLVVSWDSVRISFLYAALNGLDILSCDISNAYLEVPCGEKLWTVAGKEFGILYGTPMQINRALYGLKSACNSWHKALSTNLSNITFEPSKADPYIWLRLSTNSRGEKYQEWRVVYVNYWLAISEYPKDIMGFLNVQFKRHSESYGSIPWS